MRRKGFRRLEGKWVSEEDYYKAKGYVKYKNRWMSPEKAEKLKKQQKERGTKKKGIEALKKKLEGKMLFWDALIYIKEDVDREWMERFATNVVKKVSERLWQTTQGQAYIATATITDKHDRGNWWVQNLDGNRVTMPDGRVVYGYCNWKIIVTGGADSWTPLHELGHLLFKLPDQYSGKKSTASTKCCMAWQISPHLCPECQEKVKKMYPKWKFPNEGYNPKPPETIFKLQNQ